MEPTKFVKLTSVQQKSATHNVHVESSSLQNLLQEELSVRKSQQIILHEKYRSCGRRK